MPNHTWFTWTTNRVLAKLLPPTHTHIQIKQQINQSINKSNQSDNCTHRSTLQAQLKYQSANRFRLDQSLIPELNQLTKHDLCDRTPATRNMQPATGNQKWNSTSSVLMFSPYQQIETVPARRISIGIARSPGHRADPTQSAAHLRCQLWFALSHWRVWRLSLEYTG